MDLENSFLNAISESFKAYNKYGARSNKKLIPIHKWFAEVIENRLGDKYYTKCLGNGGEHKLNGKYYPKDLDISIFNKETDKLVATISFKFVTSNYKQNANNYFENLLGETANIRRVNIGFAHFLVLRGHTPYYTKNKGNLRGELKKIEVISEKDLMKYIKLYNDLDFPHKPNVLGIVLIDFDDNENAYFVDLDSMEFSEETKNILKNEVSLNKFIKRVVGLCQLMD